MHLIATILQELFSQLELDPASVTELELIPGMSLGQWWIHLQPERGWYAEVAFFACEWRVSTYDYITSNGG